MSKLNPGAYEFVPGRGFVAPQPAPRPPPPTERPEQVEAPLPPPTISLNIGGSRSTPPPAITPAPQTQARPPQSVIVSAVAPPTTTKPSTSAPAISKAFSTQKSKTDTNAIAQELKAVADQAVLEDLYGDGELYPVALIYYTIISLSHASQRTSKYRFHRSC